MTIQDFTSNAVTSPYQDIGRGYVVHKEAATNVFYNGSFGIYRYGKFIMRTYTWQEVVEFHNELQELKS